MPARSSRRAGAAHPPLPRMPEHRPLADEDCIPAQEITPAKRYEAEGRLLFARGDAFTLLNVSLPSQSVPAGAVLTPEIRLIDAGSYYDGTATPATLYAFGRPARADGPFTPLPLQRTPDGPTISLPAGWHPITIEWFGSGGGAAFSLKWRESRQATFSAIPPECLRPVK